jgi:hypothetical protein
VIRLAVDFASRGGSPQGEFCGEGHNARVRFDVYVLERGRKLRRFERELGSLPCGTPLAPDGRYISKLMPDIVVGNR